MSSIEVTKRSVSGASSSLSTRAGYTFTNVTGNDSSRLHLGDNFTNNITICTKVVLRKLVPRLTWVFQMSMAPSSASSRA
jgi:hypothetical protein